MQRHVIRGPLDFTGEELKIAVEGRMFAFQIAVVKIKQLSKLFETLLI